MNIASDLEGTLTSGVIGRAAARYLRGHSRRAAYTAFMASQMPRYLLSRLGLYHVQRFKNGWLLAVLAQFRGAAPAAFDDMAEWIVEQELWPRRRQDVLAELQGHSESGHRIILTSAGYAPVVEQFAARAGLSETIATRLQIENGRLTGRVAAPINGGADKARNLRAYLNGQPLNAAYGDTVADYEMLAMSQAPVAVYPDKELARRAAANGWRTIGPD